MISFNWEKFNFDLERKIYFESSIPQCYGVGSSAALVSAIYDKYALSKILVDENWYPIETPQSTVVCNVGDMLERFTNNQLPSVLHRVTTPSDAVKGSSRYSIPFFLHPNPDWFIETLPSCIDDEYPDLYPEGIMADDFLQQRLYEIKLL